MKPSDFQKTVQCRFESCLKKVVRSVVKDYYKELNRRKNKEISFSELPDVLVDKMAVWDDYETDYTIFSVCGIDIRVLDDELAEEQKNIFTKYSEFLNYFDPSLHLEINLVTRSMDEEQFRRDTFLPLRGNDRDRYAEEMNQVVAEKALRGQNGLIREKYVTFSLHAENYQQAKEQLENRAADIADHFKRMGSSTRLLSGIERLSLLQGIMRPNEEMSFSAVAGQQGLHGLLLSAVQPRPQVGCDSDLHHPARAFGAGQRGRAPNAVRLRIYQAAEPVSRRCQRSGAAAAHFQRGKAVYRECRGRQRTADRV